MQRRLFNNFIQFLYMSYLLDRKVTGKYDIYYGFMWGLFEVHLN